jgi:ferrous iron transport protein A
MMAWIMLVCNSDSFGRILEVGPNGSHLWAIGTTDQMQKRKSNVLSELKVGQTAVVSKLNLPPAVQHHLMHMGIMPDATILALRRAPAGDPTVYAVDGIEIALRRETAESIVMLPPAKLVKEDAL